MICRKCALPRLFNSSELILAKLTPSTFIWSNRFFSLILISSKISSDKSKSLVDNILAIARISNSTSSILSRFFFDLFVSSLASASTPPNKSLKTPLFSGVFAPPLPVSTRSNVMLLLFFTISVM